MSTTPTTNESVIENVTESKPKRVRKPKVATQKEETPKVKQEKPKTQKPQKKEKKEKAPKKVVEEPHSAKRILARPPKVVEEPHSAKRILARPPKVVEEPESCGVCMDNYTAIIRKKCICKFCKADTCSKCIERYLLDRHEDAHCLHCRVNYNDATLHEICTKTYLQHTYFKHRQEVLINRERANLPGLQEVAIQERKKRKDKEKIAELHKEIDEIHKQRDQVLNEYNTIYTKYYSALSASAKMIAEASRTGKKADAEDESMVKDTINDLRKKLDEGNKRSDEFRRQIDDRQTKINMIRWPHQYGIQGDNGASVKKPEEEERKKFIRRCTRDGCQGFLSTAWKCGICEYYSCGKCFVTKTKKHDDPHECKKEDVETAEMIKKDSKPCPNCGEFIMKTSGCDQMFCISCQTPWSWTSGKVVTSGPIHNPHYYEWMKRNGTAPARNPADVPCGGYPAAWELVRMPSGMRNAGQPFFEFHRICQELQDVSERTYRSHIDQTSTNGINVKFLLGDFDEKHWGQQLGKDERKKKRDREVQEIFAAFRMVAVELINRVQNYRNGRLTFTHLPTDEAEKFLKEVYVEIDALITMINDALRNVSISYSYSVPYIQVDGKYYNIKTKNFSEEVKKKRGKAKDDESVETVEADEEKVESQTVETVQGNQVIETVQNVQRRSQLSDNYPVDSDSDSSSDSEVDEYDEDAAIQLAIQKSLGIQP